MSQTLFYEYKNLLVSKKSNFQLNYTQIKKSFVDLVI